MDTMSYMSSSELSKDRMPKPHARVVAQVFRGRTVTLGVVDGPLLFREHRLFVKRQSIARAQRKPFGARGFHQLLARTTERLRVDAHAVDVVRPAA